MTRRVRAAGGVVWRTGDDGAVEVALVHRPRYDDWSLPKGKLERGERHRDAALREVDEETGLVCELGVELPRVRYETPRGEDKTVRFWTMTVDRERDFAPNDEVDTVAWCTLGEAQRRCTHGTDRDTLQAFADTGVAPARP